VSRALSLTQSHTRGLLCLGVHRWQRWVWSGAVGVHCGFLLNACASVRHGCSQAFNEMYTMHVGGIPPTKTIDMFLKKNNWKASDGVSAVFQPYTSL
jgi:hypothetical protein